MKKIVIFGDCNSIWLKSYVREVLCKISNCMIYIFSEKRPIDIQHYSDIRNIKVVDCSVSSKLNNTKLGFLFYVFNIVWSIHRIGKVDYIHIHFVNKRKLYAVNLVKRCSKKIIISFWGSDLLRKDNKEIYYFLKYLSKVDFITVGSADMFDFAKQKLPTSIIKKTSIFRFGVNGLDSIHNSKSNITELRKIWGLPDDKIIIAIGYNGSEQQNHLKVIEQLIQYPKEIKEKVHIILPMTYGLNENYLKRINEIMAESKFTYSIYLDYMNNEKITELCLAVDAFIHAQNTDAFSASVQEYLCAGKLLFNPKWIRYKELVQRDVFYITYESYEEMGKIVAGYIINGITEHEVNKLVNNQNILYELSSWESLRNRWMRLYE